jgi:hypothetical protein
MLIETILGVVTGIAGNVVTSITNLKTQKLKNEQDLKMREYDIKERAQEATLQMAVDSNRLEGELEKLETDAYLQSMKIGNETLLTDAKLSALSSDGNWLSRILAFLMGLVDIFRSSVRPGLTAYLVVLTTLITMKSMAIITAKTDLLTTMQAQEIFGNVTNIVIYLTVSCVTWWFGDRRTAKFAYRLNDGNKTDKSGF